MTTNGTPSTFAAALSTLTLTAKDVARLAGCTPLTVDRAIKAGALPDLAAPVEGRRYQRAVPLEAARTWAADYREQAQRRTAAMEHARLQRELRTSLRGVPKAVVRKAATRCGVCGAAKASHTDVLNGHAGHRIDMPGDPLHGVWHPFTQADAIGLPTPYTPAAGGDVNAIVDGLAALVEQQRQTNAHLIALLDVWRK